MGRRPHPRPFRAFLLVTVAATLLAGCEPGQFGLSGREAEWERRGEFVVVSTSPRRAVVSARGRPVAVEPPAGFCVAEDSVETSERSAFVLIGDCVLQDGPGAMAIEDGGLDLPPGMPGITTVSISGDPGFGPSGVSAEDLSELESYLATAEGRELLGRGGSDLQVSVVETRREDGTLYILVEDRAAEAVPLLAPRFWRAFVELNGRLAVVTVSGFRDVPMEEADMLRHLGDQVRQLRVANAVPIEEAPIQVAEAPRRTPSDQAEADDRAEAEAGRLDGTLKSSPADAWAKTTLADAGAAHEETPTAVPEAALADDWLSLAAGGPEPAEAAGADPVDAWSELAAGGQGAGPVGWPTIRNVPRPATRPMSSEPPAAGTLWPAPPARPAKRTTGPTQPPEPAAGAAAHMPMPTPRMGDSSEDAIEAFDGTTTPLPPRRVSR